MARAVPSDNGLYLFQSHDHRTRMHDKSVWLHDSQFGGIQAKEREILSIEVDTHAFVLDS